MNHMADTGRYKPEDALQLTTDIVTAYLK